MGHRPGIGMLVGFTLAALAIGACSSGDDANRAPSTSGQRSTLSSGEAASIVSALWQRRDTAIFEQSAAAFSEVDADPALLSDRSYWIDYCVDYCPAPPEPASKPPGVDVLAVGEDGTTLVAFLTTTSSWPTGDEVPLAAIVRASQTEGRWRFTLVNWWSPKAPIESLPSGSLRPFDDDGRTLTDSYLDLVDQMSETGAYPADSPFAKGQFTDGYLEVLGSFREPGPEEVSTYDERLAPENATVGFTILGDDNRSLHCALYGWTSTSGHRDGGAFRPEDVVGDYGHVIGDGLYTSLTVEGIDRVCVVDEPNRPPTVLVFNAARTRITGQAVS